MGKLLRRKLKRQQGRRSKKLQDLIRPLKGLSPIEQWNHPQLQHAYSLFNWCEDILETKTTADERAALIKNLIEVAPSICKLIGHYIELRRAIIPTQADETSISMALAVDRRLGRTIRKGDLGRARDAASQEFKTSLAKVAGAHQRYGEKNRRHLHPPQGADLARQWRDRDLTRADFLLDLCQEPALSEAPEYLVDELPSLLKLVRHYIELRQAIIPGRVDEKSTYIAYLVDLKKTFYPQAVARKVVAAILDATDEEVARAHARYGEKKGHGARWQRDPDWPILIYKPGLKEPIKI